MLFKVRSNESQQLLENSESEIPLPKCSSDCLRLQQYVFRKAIKQSGTQGTSF